MHVYAQVLMWSPEVDAGHFSQLLSNLYIETGSRTKFRACWFGLAHSPACSKDSSIFPPEGWIIGRPPHLPGIYIVLGNQTLVITFVWHVLCPLIHLLSFYFLFSSNTVLELAYSLHWGPLWVNTLFYLQWNLHVDQQVRRNQYQNFIGHQFCDLPLHFTDM